MPNINDTYSSLIKKEDLQESPKVYTITGSEIQEFENKKKGGVDRKIILHLEEEERGFPLNKTNASVLASIFQSQNTDDWVGKQFEAFFDPTVRFGGQVVGGLGVRPVK